MELNQNEKDMLVRLGKNIAETRKKAGKTQAEIAEIINVDALSISRIERGATSPSLHTLSKIALALNILISTLFTGASTSIESLSEGIASLLENLPEEHRVFLYRQIKDWCEHFNELTPSNEQK